MNSIRSVFHKKERHNKIIMYAWSDSIFSSFHRHKSVQARVSRKLLKPSFVKRDQKFFYELRSFVWNLILKDTALHGNCIFFDVRQGYHQKALLSLEFNPTKLVHYEFRRLPDNVSNQPRLGRLETSII